MVQEFLCRLQRMAGFPDKRRYSVGCSTFYPFPLGEAIEHFLELTAVVQGTLWRTKRPAPSRYLMLLRIGSGTLNVLARSPFPNGRLNPDRMQHTANLVLSERQIDQVAQTFAEVSWSRVTPMVTSMDSSSPSARPQRRGSISQRIAAC
jgi:hypothetical protein